MKFRARHSTAVIVTLLAAACAPRTGTGTPEPTGPITLTASDVSAVAELLRMEDARSLDTALISRHLRSTTPEVRRRAALAAGRLSDRVVTPLLLGALDDPSGAVRAAAAFSLGELADSSVAVAAALGRVALRDPSHAALEAASAIGRIGAEPARVTIDSLLTGRHRPALVQEALLAAWRLPRNEATRDAVAGHTDSGDSETRWRAAYALARTMGPGAVRHLIPMTGDDQAIVRAQAVRGLRASLADSAGLREQALSAVLRTARDEHPHARINAAALLPGYREPARTTPALLTLLRDVDMNVAIAAASALGASGDTAAIAALRNAAMAVPAPPAPAAANPRSAGLLHGDGLRTAALAALARIDAPAAAAIATAWSDSSRWILRMHGARALGSAAWPTASASLQRLARDGSYLVAAEALGAIRSASDSADAQVRTIFIDALAAPHPLVRAAATSGLARSATAADLDILLQAYDRARTDSVRDAAVAAVNALGRLRRAGVPADRSFYLRFGQYGPPADPALFRAIASQIQNLPTQWGPLPEPRPQPHDIAFYTDIVNRYVAPVLAGAPAPRATITTVHGDVVLELASAEAPLTVHNFVSLIERGYYVNNRWHRVVPNFVIQDGDPRGDGSGGPGYQIRDEINPLRYHRGALGMALSGPDTGGSQWFITHSPQPHLDGGYTVFGRVVAGMDAVDRVVQEEPILRMSSSR